MIDQNLRTEFLNKLYDKIVSSKFLFNTEPDFRSFKHGNLKFVDTRLTLFKSDYKIIVTLEHYHIKREGWHPLYWGLQIFNLAGNVAIDPNLIKETNIIVQKMQDKLKSQLNIDYDLSQIEAKFGWFAWSCFCFSNQTSDLDNPFINTIFETNMNEISMRVEKELMAYLNAWQAVILELNS